MIIIGIMSKSGCGKSTVINKLCENNKVYHNVKSYTTRKIRENDPNDINTHIFVDEQCWEDNKLKSWATYIDDKNNYVNWTDASSFNKYKVNLYAIDSKAFKEISKRNEDTFGIYLELDEYERENRLIKRGSAYQNESHLSSDHIFICQNKVIIDINGKSVEQVADVIENVINTFLTLKGYTKVNGLLCKKCNRILISRNRHDFNVCENCKTTFIDGGFDYVRWGAKDLDKDAEIYPVVVKNSIYDIITEKVVNQIQLK